MAGEDPTAIKALHDLEKRLNCAICLEQLTEPKSLPCFHAFCKGCLGNLPLLPRGDGHVLRCLVCRSLARLPEAGISAFPNASHFDDLLELRQQLKKLSEAKNIACENCDENDATGFCRQCGIFVCRSCTDAHLRLSKLFPDHEMVGLKEVISTVSQLIPVKQQPVMECSTHKKPMDIYCETCQLLVCQHCTIHHHRDHECDFITDNNVYQKHLQQIQELILPTKEKLAAVIEAVLALAKQSEEVIRSKERVKKQIRERGQLLIAEYTVAVQESVQLLTEEVEEGAKEKLGFLSAHKDEAEMAATLLQNCLNYIEEELRMDSMQRILASKTQMMDRMQLVTSQVKVESFSPVEEADFQFDADKQVVEMPRTIGRVEFSTLARRCTVMGKGVATAVPNQPTTFQLAIKPLCARPLLSFPVSLVSCWLTSPSTSCMIDCDVKETCSGMYEVTHTPIIRGPNWLRVSVGGIEIPGSPFVVNVTPSPDMRGYPVQSITILDAPLFMAFCGKNQLIVTELNRHCVTMLDKDGKKMKSFGSEGSAHGQFQSPTGVTTTPDNHILVVDRDNGRIQKFTMDGRFVAAVGSKGSGECQFEFPQSIHVHPSGKVLVADCGNDRIQVLNSDLSFSHSFGSRGSQSGKFRKPFDMCTDDEGMVYVTDSGNHRIQKFTLKGRFVARFKGKMNEPHGITIDSNTLYVSNNHFVSIFDTSGKLLRVFGKKGSGDAEFNSPFGVVVGECGDLYVCDGHNNRVVVY